MSNATFSRKPLVAAVLTTLAVFSAGAMAGNEDQPVKSRSRTPPSRTMTRATSSRPKPTRRKAKTTRSPKRALA